MKIDLLMEREPFPEIFENTLSDFLQSWKGESYEVEWKNVIRPFGLLHDQGQLWFCNHHLNAIFPRNVTPNVFDPIRREFAHSTVRWRQPIQRLYVSLATSPVTSSLLSQSVIEINPPLSGAESLLIVGGNHKLRILDILNQTSYGVLKDGFPTDFFQQEINIRKKAQDAGLPVPELQEISEDESWFSERYISATPLNRIADRSVVDQSWKDLYQQLNHFYDQTGKEESLLDYVEKIYQFSKENIHANHLLDPTDKAALLDTLEDLSNLVVNLGFEKERRIKTVLSHGDFQPANILLNNKGTWLIDWEYADRRQREYDYLVFVLESRFPGGLSERVDAFLYGSSGKILGLGGPFTGLLDLTSHKDRLFHLMLFLMEEFSLRVKESNNQIFVQLQPGFHTLHSEINKMIKKIKEGE